MGSIDWNLQLHVGLEVGSEFCFIYRCMRRVKWPLTDGLFSCQNPLVMAAEDLLGYFARRQVTNNLPFEFKSSGGYGFDKNL